MTLNIFALLLKAFDLRIDERKGFLILDNSTAHISVEEHYNPLSPTKRNLENPAI